MGSGTSLVLRPAFAVYGADLFASGSYQTADEYPAYGVARWTGSEWRSVSPGTDGHVYSISRHADDLIVAGSFTSLDGTKARCIARRHDESWAALGDGFDGAVRAVLAYKGELIAAGEFITSSNTTLNRVAKWDGSHWLPMGAGMNKTVRALIEFRGDLIASGDFNVADEHPANCIARWTGSEWVSLGAGLTTAGGASLPIVYALAIYDGDLIAAGSFDLADGSAAANIARWDGTAWAPLGQGITRGNLLSASVRSLCTFEEKLVAAGFFGAAGAVSLRHIAAWDGAQWSALGPSLEGDLQCITVDRGELVAAGYFRYGNPTLRTVGIARLHADSWELDLAGPTWTVECLQSEPSLLWAGGIFYEVGMSIGVNLASRSPTIAPPTISLQPTRQTIPLAQPATFQVAATGGQPLTYQWRKNGELLTDNPNISGSQTDTLTIASATQSDTGQYDCLITNDCGNATTTPARLTVLIPIPGPPLNQVAQPASND